MRALRFAMLALMRDWRSGELAVLLLSSVHVIVTVFAPGWKLSA
mgnify:CR=1 FL=1